MYTCCCVLVRGVCVCVFMCLCVARVCFCVCFVVCVLLVCAHAYLYFDVCL